jgi:hypothetical protein
MLRKTIPNVSVDVVQNVRFYDFWDVAMSYPTSIDVLDRVTVDVCAKTPYCMMDVCGVV